MPRKKASKRGGKGKAKKAADHNNLSAAAAAAIASASAAVSGSLLVDDNSNDLADSNALADDHDPNPRTPTSSPPALLPLAAGVVADLSDSQGHPDLDDTATEESPSAVVTMEPEQPSPSMDGEHSKDGSESEVLHTGFMQMGPKTYRCGSVIINMDKADDETMFHFKPKDVAIEVECGENRAMMYLSKLYQGSKGKCIEFGDGWITPNEFQTMSGRESAKDWKRSIRHRGRSLKLLLSKGILVVHPAACKCDGCLLLQQLNGKTPSVDGLSGDEGKKKKSKSGSSKKKKKGKEKAKERDKEDRGPAKDQQDAVLASKTELNGDLAVLGPPLASNNNTAAGIHEGADRDNGSSVDSSASSSDEEDSSEDDSEEEEEKEAKKRPKASSEEPAPKGIKMKINLATSTAKTQSSSSEDSSSGESSDDSDDSSDEDDNAGDAPLHIDPASLNSPLFPDLNADGTAVTRTKPTLLTTIKKPLGGLLNPRTPELKKEGESSSEDDEPLANINRHKQAAVKPQAKPELPDVPLEALNGAENNEVLESKEETKAKLAYEVEEMETNETTNPRVTDSEQSILDDVSKDELNAVPLLAAERTPDNASLSTDVEMGEDYDKKDIPMDLGPKRENPLFPLNLLEQHSAEKAFTTREDQNSTVEVLPRRFSPGVPYSGMLQTFANVMESAHRDNSPLKHEGLFPAQDLSCQLFPPLLHPLPLPLSKEELPKEILPPLLADVKEQPSSREEPHQPPATESYAAMDLSADTKPSTPAIVATAPATPASEAAATAAAAAAGAGGGGGNSSGSEESSQVRSIPAVPPLVPVTKLDRKPTGKLSRLSNIIENLRVTKEKQSLSGGEGGEPEGSTSSTPERKASPALPASSKSPYLPPQLVSARPEDKRQASGASSSFTPPPAAHRRSSPVPPSPVPPSPASHTPQQQSSTPLSSSTSFSSLTSAPGSGSGSASRQRHSPSPSQHSRKSSSSSQPAASATSSSHLPHSFGSPLPSSSSSHLPYLGISGNSTSSSAPKSSSGSREGSSSSKPLGSSSSSSSQHHSSTNVPSSSSSTSRPSTTSTPSFVSIPSMLSTSPSSVSAAAASPLLAAASAGTVLSRHQQEQLALSLQQMMARGIMPGDINSQAQAFMAYQMAQAEAALQLQQASYMQKMSADMQKMSAQSKAERDYQLAAMSLLPWPPRPDLMPFHPFTAHHHLLAMQQQQQQQQQLQQQMREKEMEKEKLKQQQKQREREQQQKRERERERERAEREREQQKLRQEQMDRKLHQQKLQEQQQHLRQKMMVEQQRKIDAAHSQLLQRERDVSKRSYETMLGLSLPGMAGLAGLATLPSSSTSSSSSLAAVAASLGEQPRQAHSHSDPKKARTSFPSSSAPPPGKPRPSHTKENGSGGGGGSSSSGGGGSRGGGGGSVPNPLSLPVPVPISPMASHGIWSNCFPHSLPPPSMDMAQLSKYFEDASKKAAADAGRSALPTSSASSSSSASPATNRTAAHAVLPSAAPSSSAVRSAHSFPAASVSATTSSSGSGGEVLDLSVSKR